MKIFKTSMSFISNKNYQSFSANKKNKVNEEKSLEIDSEKDDLTVSKEKFDNLLKKLIKKNESKDKTISPKH